MLFRLVTVSDVKCLQVWSSESTFVEVPQLSDHAKKILSNCKCSDETGYIEPDVLVWFASFPAFFDVCLC